MIVGMWMAREVATVEPQVRLVEAARLMTERRIRRLPVARRAADGLHLEGMLSATDLYRALPPDCNPFAPRGLDALESGLSVEQIMTRAVLTTTPETPIEDAARIMRDRKVGALVVVRGDALVGLITESDIFRAFISLFEDHAAGARITLDASTAEDVFGLLAEEAQNREIRVLSLVSSRQNGERVAVARVAGPEVDLLLEDLWAAGHRVLNVLRWPR